MPVAKLWAFRLIAVVGIPVLLLGGAELVLRLAGVGQDTAFLQRVTIDGRDHWRDNPDFFTLFFPPNLLPRQLPVVVPVEKGARELRVGLLGASAAQGIPEPAYGMAVFLEEQLRHRHPDHDVRVLNLANTAINSHVVARIAKGVEPLDLDAFVVYMGNNEVVGPFGAGTVLTQEAPPAWRIDLTLWLRSTRLGQVLMGLGAGRDTPTLWRGMEMFTEQRVASDDPALARVRVQFERNLRTIADQARALDVPMVLSTVAVNLRHCAPFGGASLDRLPLEDLRRRDAAIAAGDSAQARGDANEAFHAYDAARALDSRSADIMYRLGRLRLAAGDTSETTLQDFLNALDHDTLRFRADPDVNRILREVAEDLDHVTLADVEAGIASVSPGGLAGREVFFEHVHFDVYGNQVASRVLADALESAPESAFANPVDAGWLDSAEITNRAGYTVVERQRVLGEVARLLMRPPFTSQLDQPEQLMRITNDLRRVAAEVPRQDLMSLWPQYQASMRERAWDWLPRFRAATFLSDLAKEPARAEPLWRGLVKDLPHYPAAAFGMGRTLAYLGRYAEAKTWYERSLELYPYQPSVKVAWADAARALAPNDPAVRLEALEREERALRLEGSQGALNRLRLRLAEDALWWQVEGDADRAAELRRRAADLETVIE